MKGLLSSLLLVLVLTWVVRLVAALAGVAIAPVPSLAIGVAATLLLSLLVRALRTRRPVP